MSESDKYYGKKKTPQFRVEGRGEITMEIWWPVGPHQASDV